MGGGNEAVTGCRDWTALALISVPEKRILWVDKTRFPAAPYCRRTPYHIPDKLLGQELSLPH